MRTISFSRLHLNGHGKQFLLPGESHIRGRVSHTTFSPNMLTRGVALGFLIPPFQGVKVFTVFRGKRQFRERLPRARFGTHATYLRPSDNSEPWVERE